MNMDFKYYLITDPKYYSNNPKIFKRTLEENLKKHKINIACFRDKKSDNFKELAQIFIETCREFNIEKVLINGDYQLAKKLNASGVHLTSTQFNDIQKAKDLDLYTIISCHSFNDIQKAIDKHVNTITYSPIFSSPNKGEPKGIDKLKEAKRIFEDIDIIALGGIINTQQIQEIQKAKAYGFASIRYFI